MKMKQVLAGAVATAFVAPVAALAAIDDQGMQYVSAGEGLAGSLRVDVLIDTDAADEDVSTATESLRLWTAGDLDLGGGLQSTYYIELRGGSDSDTTVTTHAYDIGVKGPFGHVTFGRLGMVAFRLTPSADLAFVRGVNRAAFGADPGPNGIRYESPVINGFQFGVSGILNGSGGPDGSLDEYSLGVKYTLPIGLEVGAGYELEDVTEYETPTANTYTGGPTGATFAAGDSVWAGAPVTTGSPTIADSMADVTAIWGSTGARQSDSMSGFRFGARYGQDNWLVGYEYRGYEGFKPNAIADYSDGSLGQDRVIIDSNAPGSAFSMTEALDAFIVDGDAGLDYAVHAVGAQAKVDRVTMSAAYSTEENTYEGSLVQNGGEITLERETIAIDAAYALGSRSHMVIGWKREDYSSTLNPFGAATATANGSTDNSTTFLFYRVDF